jgi:hypothetical protein
MLQCTQSLVSQDRAPICIQATREWQPCFIVRTTHIDKETSLSETLFCGNASLRSDGFDQLGRRFGRDDHMKDVWQSVPGTRFFSRNGEGLYERLTDQLYLRVDEVDETDAREVCTRFAEAFEARAPVRMLA